MKTNGNLHAPRTSSAKSAETYDRLPYPSLPYPLTHPDRLAVMGTLHGMTPTPPAGSRILEIGCASGGNLIPMACNLPHSNCLGIDISSRQIDIGQRTIAEIKLDNIELRAEDILEFTSDERFDYIIAHGVFSWVPPDTRESLLRLIRNHLSPHGVAYISYNVYPGFKHNTMMREIMQHHTRDIRDPEERANEALKFVGFLAEAAEKSGSAEAARLQSFHEQLMARPERVALLFHEYLENDNHPMYFHEFAAQLDQAGLHYISDADPTPHDRVNTPADVMNGIRGWCRNRLEEQQYLDFVHNTRFRRSLVCRADASIAQEMSPAATASMSVTTQSKEVPDPEEGTSSAPRFMTTSGTTFTPTHPLVAGILRHLRDCWPAATPCPSIFERFPGQDLPQVMLSLYRSGIINLHPAAPECCASISEKPVVNAFTRFQARQERYVTNLYHSPIKVDDDMARLLLPRLDGTRDLSNLAAEMEAAVKEGRLKMEYHGKPLREQVGLSNILPSFIEFHLGKLVDLALLSG